MGDKMFSQDDVNRIVQRRLLEERTKKDKKPLEIYCLAGHISYHQCESAAKHGGFIKYVNGKHCVFADFEGEDVSNTDLEEGMGLDLEDIAFCPYCGRALNGVYPHC